MPCAAPEDRPFITALSKERLVDDLGNVDEVKQLVRARAGKPLRSNDDIKAWIPTLTADEVTHLGVRSDYFYVRVQVAQDDVELSTDALIARAGNTPPAILWRRPRY